MHLVRNGEWLVVVVADGVSNSGLSSHRAADLATRMGSRIIAETLENGVLPADIQWKDQIHAKISSSIIRSAAKRSGKPLPPDGILNNQELLEYAELMATTAVAAIIGTQVYNGHVPYYAVSLAGDSSIFILREQQFIPVVGGKPNGERIKDSSVYALPLPIAEEPPVNSGYLAPGEAILLMSDGLGDPIGVGEGAVGKHFAATWSRVPEKWDFAKDVDFHRRSFDDDRTVVGVWL